MMDQPLAKAARFLQPFCANLHERHVSRSNASQRNLCKHRRWVQRLSMVAVLLTPLSTLGIAAAGIAGCARTYSADESSVVDLALRLTTVHSDGSPASSSGEVCLVASRESGEDLTLCHLVRTDESGLLWLARRESEGDALTLIPQDDSEYSYETSLSEHELPTRRVFYDEDGSMRFFLGTYVVEGSCWPSRKRGKRCGKNNFPAMRDYRLSVVLEGTRSLLNLNLDGEDQPGVSRAHKGRSFVGTFEAKLVLD